MIEVELIYLGMSAIAQALFAVSAIPFWLKFTADPNSRFAFFEWTWYVGELLAIVGALGLGRYDLLMGLVLNFIFLTLCLGHHVISAYDRKKMEDWFKELPDRPPVLPPPLPTPTRIEPRTKHHLKVVKDEEPN